MRQCQQNPQDLESEGSEDHLGTNFFTYKNMLLVNFPSLEDQF
jgi:hypothetical protein